MMPQEISVVQSDKDWKLWRLEGVGASDTPIILGLSKYSTRKKLLMTKAKRIIDETKNIVLDKGHHAEKIQREVLKANLSLKLFKDVKIEAPVLEHPKYKWIRASLDGWVEGAEDEPYAWEHKLTGKDKLRLLRNGACPDDFYAQAQHQMFVSGCKKVILQGTLLGAKLKVSFKETALIEIKRDEEFIKYLFKEIKKFWEEVLDIRE